MLLNVLVENGAFQPATPADAASWRDRFSLPFPVVADTEGTWAAVWGNVGDRAYRQHSYTLVDADGIVLWRRLEHQTFDDTVLDEIVAQLEAL